LILVSMLKRTRSAFSNARLLQGGSAGSCFVVVRIECDEVEQLLQVGFTYVEVYARRKRFSHRGQSKLLVCSGDQAEERRR
jgi:hypothetical protein